MADVIKKATNKFTKGLVMDFSPENTKSEVLTHALNATLLTFNGNELLLLNDMGNARVETAFLPEGYMPVGVCEYGGILYIVSYNPLENKSLIGCFPSPERNISNEELGCEEVVIRNSDFLDGSGNAMVLNTSYKVLLKQSDLNPGDKFLIHSNKDTIKNRLKNLLINGEEVLNPILALNVVSIDDNGRIVYITNDVLKYKFESDGSSYEYHINANTTALNELVDLDVYRNVLSSGYSVFKEKTSGKLAILAELITIDSYSVTHSIQKGENGEFDVIIHTEVSPELPKGAYDMNPKLAYYYLEKSDGYLLGSNSVYNINLPDFMNTKLNAIYTSEKEELKNNLNVTLTESKAAFNFPKKDTYHRRERVLNGEWFDENTPITTEFKERAYHRVSFDQLDLDYFVNDLKAKFYTFNGDSETYIEYEEETINWDYVYYVKQPVITYIDIERDVEYLETPLYKLEVVLAVADASVILNKEVEKFKDNVEHIYKKASEEDKNGTATLFFKSGVDSYTEASKLLDPNEVYYILENKITKVSLGFEIAPENVPSVVYYYANSPTYSRATLEELNTYWDFDTYPQKAPFDLFRRLEDLKYVQASDSFLETYVQGTEKIYTKYGYMPINLEFGLPPTALVILPKTAMVKFDKFQPNVDINYIEGYNAPDEIYPGEKPIKLYVVELYLPTKPIDNNSFGMYEDVKLASLKLPKIVDENNLTFPFKYDYTLVPCMEFGKLEYLKVSNSVDFSKLYLFDKSEFNVWKYRVDGNLLILTLGASVYDTFETNKVDALVLEFYDSKGPVGILEISGKKSYSGLFTKVLELNEYRQLKKVCATKHGAYGSIDPSNGSKEDGRIGILKSNTIYAVKPYFRVAESLNSEKVNFILKDPMVLITLPVNNLAYSTIDNFNTITEIPLSMVLTYRMQDISKHKLIESKDLDVINYKTGIYKGTELNFKSEVEFEGATKVLLAIGLHKDYEQFGLLSDVDLAKCFECTLEVDAIEGLRFGFKYSENKTTLQLVNVEDCKGIERYNFLNNGDKYIIIDYIFTTHYDTYIKDIRKTSIPATTVCALYHKQPDGIYNYSDFGLYEITNGDISCYLSDLVFYNSGSKSESIFGTARMAITDEQQMYFLCIPQRQFVLDTVPLTSAGRLNAGEPLRSVINSVGKLAFCQPHAHVLLEDSYSSNITYTDGYYLKFGNKDLCADIVTRPVYNMCANTIDMIDYQSKFISTVAYNESPHIYNGLNQYELAKFNRLLLNSMSGIYAYNPDYSSFPIRIGSVSVTNPSHQFNSNLYCTNSKFNFDGQSLNDYLFLTQTIVDNEVITVTLHLNALSNRVKNIPHVQFIPDTTYCGSSESAYLISLLTYNLEVPDELYRNLEFDFENGLFVMHSDGSWNFLEGSINKNTLYGFLKRDNKQQLIQLDISTYNIDENGFVLIYGGKINQRSESVIIPASTFENTDDSGDKPPLIPENPPIDLDPDPDNGDLNLDIGDAFPVALDYGDSLVGRKKFTFTAITTDGTEIPCTVYRTIGSTFDRVKLEGDWIYCMINNQTTVSGPEVSFLSLLGVNYVFEANTDYPNASITINTEPECDACFVKQQDGLDPQTVDITMGEWFDSNITSFDVNENVHINKHTHCVKASKTVLEVNGGKCTKLDFVYSETGPGFAIYRFYKGDLDVTIRKYNALSDFTETVVHVDKTQNYFSRKGNIYQVTDMFNKAFVGSSITINDLLYKPELTGHRLYIRDLYSPVDGAKIYYRHDENIDDYGLNYINLFSGPCYTGLLVDSTDPEFDMEKKFNSQ